MNKSKVVYIIINYSCPNITNMTARISFLCHFLDSNDKDFYYWSYTKKDLGKAKYFDDRETYETYIKNMKLENTISYGIDIKELQEMKV